MIVFFFLRVFDFIYMFEGSDAPYLELIEWYVLFPLRWLFGDSRCVSKCESRLAVSSKNVL